MNNRSSNSSTKEQDIPDSLRGSSKWLKDLYGNLSSVKPVGISQKKRLESLLSDFNTEAENIGKLDLKTRDLPHIQEYMKNKYGKSHIFGSSEGIIGSQGKSNAPDNSVPDNSKKSISLPKYRPFPKQLSPDTGRSIPNTPTLNFPRQNDSIHNYPLATGEASAKVENLPFIFGKHSNKVENLPFRIGKDSNKVVSLNNFAFNNANFVNLKASISPRIDIRTFYESIVNGVQRKDIGTAFILSLEAKDKAKQYAEEKGLDGINSNEADAYRHFYWNYEMCKKMDLGDALRCSSAHEIAFLQEHKWVTDSHTGNKDERDAFMPFTVIMDVWNNRRAMYAYKTGNYESVEEAFNDCLQKGQLMTNPNDAYKFLGAEEHMVAVKETDQGKIWGFHITFTYLNGVIVDMRLDESVYGTNEEHHI